ncbi:HelD family protein [Herbiconiux sp. SYSU D00978]|uniref:HelD family protein n=1 Tax=Herbiconiux sp. SYSU D00978 TaxID=2812562 RepID=UPI001A96829E|nr:UvrD-helicase domain-containing protein [Herbiconiux sp. SYSU D00978]
MASELEREQEYVSGLYARLDAIKSETRAQLTEVRRQQVGGNHQARSERDAFARIYEDRIAQLDEVDERLVFGRLELEDGEDDTELRYIGRIGLRDADLEPILLDWRVPKASAFYQATAANPMGARARRHLMTRGRKVIRIEDEVFDEELLGSDSVQLQGEGALLAALTAQRTGRMGDIVATIQAEQDRIIRSELRGVLVVQGGPGTGKTAVALHRAAYLLYAHRERLARSGVLIVGPSRSFLEYIEQVLPSLGESGVVLMSVGQLYPGVEATTDDPADAAALKGDARMADLIKRAVRSRQVVPSETQYLDVNGTSLRVRPEVIARAMRRAQERNEPHNVARVTFNRLALRELSRLLAEQLRRGGSTVDDDDLPVLAADLRDSYDVRVALNTAWMPLTPEKLVQDLWARPNWFASLTPDWTEAERRAVRRGRDEPFTVSDIPLLDEAAEHLGAFDPAGDARKREAARQRERDLENAEHAIQNMQVEGMVSAETLAAGFAESAERLTTAERAATDRTWAFGHIVVDEAQELSPMQWRLLRRRAPLRSFTIVGDIAQASTVTAADDWGSALATLTQDFVLEELTVNYRTPQQITELAERVARERGLPITPSRAVRASEWDVFRTESAGRPVPAAVEAVAADRALGRPGSLAVIAPSALVEPLAAALESQHGGDVALGRRTLAAPITVLTPQESKGLEFDAVVLVDPDAIAADGPRGPSALYVAMTRPTQRLHLVMG